jgi:hypothetical protein
VKEGPEDKEIKDNNSVKKDKEERDKEEDKDKGFKDRLSNKKI